MTEPVGVILAAGRATRMGRPKQLLEFGDGTVLGTVISRATASRLTRVVVVLGAYAAEIQEGIDLAEVEVAINQEPDRGNLSSLLIAAEHVGTPLPLLLLMGDMPGVSAMTIDRHLAAPAGWMRVTEYDDGIGHPYLLSAELLADLPDAAASKPLWTLANSGRADRLTVAGPMPIDVDTPADYDAARAIEGTTRE